MRIMVCPLNGPRNIEEFHCRGVVKTMPDPSTSSDEQWAEYLFMESNQAGMVREWWLHVPSSTWFIAERDTVTGEIHATYLPEQMNSKAAK